MTQRRFIMPVLCTGLLAFAVACSVPPDRGSSESEREGEVSAPGGSGTGSGDTGSGGTGSGGAGGDPCGTECTDLTYTACTCGSSDPCGWDGDGVCDASCAQYASAPFDDSADCRGVYQNDPDEVLANLNQVFRCLTTDDAYVNLSLFAGAAELYDFDDAGNRIHYAAGTYTTSGGLIINFDGYAPEPASDLEIELDRLITFTLPSFPSCWVIASNDGFAEERFYACPSIHYIPNVGWDDNYFTLSTYGQAVWRNEQNVSATADTLYTTTYGIYRVEPGFIALAFPTSDEERFLTGTLSDDGTQIWIDQLEPEQGPCVLQ